MGLRIKNKKAEIIKKKGSYQLTWSKDQYSNWEIFTEFNLIPGRGDWCSTLLKIKVVFLPPLS